MMTNPINPGAVVPFYAAASHLAHFRQVSRHSDGWRILAPNTSLLPFLFWLDAAPATVTAFEAINVGTGQVTAFSTGLIDRRKRSDNSRTWYIFDGSDLGTTLDCGVYKIRLHVGSSVYISDEIEVINAPGQETISLTTGSCSASVLRLTASDTLEGTIAEERFEYRRTNATTWTTLTPTSTGPAVYDFSLSPKNLAGVNYLIRRTVRTSAGSVLQSFYSITWGAVDPCADYVLTLIDERNSYPNGDLWYLELSDAEDWEDKIYESGFVERVYLRGEWDFPEAEREVEVLVDNAGNREISTADTREFQRMVFDGVADHLVGILSALGDYDTIALKNQARNYSVTGIPGTETEFTTEPSVGYYSKGRLRFRDLKHFETACLDGETTVVP